MLASALLAFVAAALVGFVADQLLFRFLDSRAVRDGWAAGRQLATGLHGAPTVVGVLIGARLALRRLPLPAETAQALNTTVEVAAIVAVTAFGARVLGRIVRAYTERPGSRLPSTSIFVNLARGVVWVLGLISVLASLGVSIAPLITALGVGGLAVGLALQPTLENVFSGIQVLAARQIEPGDFIRLETGEEGTILDVTWRNTTVLTPNNDVVIVPNSVLGRSLITNFSTHGAEHVLVVPVTVSARADTALVERIAREVAAQVLAEVDGAVPDAEASVRFAAVGPTGVQVNTALRVRSYPERILVRHEFIRRLQERFAAEGVDGADVPPALGVAPST
jgi:small-conductance mechanosensitive channel